MNANNYTQKSLEAVQTAQAMAQENRNNYLAPEHLLDALYASFKKKPELVEKNRVLVQEAEKWIEENLLK